ncbi:MAG: sugar transferase [Paludibacteraceae bacterium]
MLYKPQWKLLVGDVCFFCVAMFAFYLMKDYSVRFFFARYTSVFCIVAAVWMCVGYGVGKYRPLKQSRYRRSMMRLVTTVAITMCVSLPLAYGSIIEFSILQTVLLICTVFLQNVMVVGLVHIFYYAAYIDEEPGVYEERPPAAVLQQQYRIDDHTITERLQAIEAQTTPAVGAYVCQNVDIQSSNTLVLATSNVFNYTSLRNYRYDTIVNLEKLNNIRGINKMFCAANAKLPDAGKVLFCFESRSTRKQRLLNKWPFGLGWLFYACDFVWKRIVPKLFLTNRLYYDITQGRNRVLTKTEVLGRLYYCGFEVFDQQVIDGYTLVVARRLRQPNQQVRKRYGPLIKLRRIGKNGRYFDVYKMRTMHPYAEYLQQYMYEHHHLQDGGKIADDIRISTLGRFMRRCWLDELPMFINLFRGEMKLVGVRPLSQQYFNLYSKELQQKRIRFKPGLLPPFYADMPKTLDEIQASEMKYLTMCEKRGCFIADNYYFWKIVYNILIKRARSN